MSTKINNSYKVYAKSLDEVIQILQTKASNNNIDDFLKQLKQDRTTNIITKLYDLTILKNTLIKDLNNSQIINNEDYTYSLKSYFLQNEKETEDNYDYFYLDTENYVSEISIFPKQFKDQYGTYYLFIGLNNHYIEEATKFHIEQLMDDYPISTYDYQNSTDKPDNVSKKEWLKRAKDWDVVMPIGNIRQEGIVLHIAQLPIRNYQIDTISNNFINKNPISVRMKKIVNEYIANNIFLDLLNQQKEKTSNPNAELPISAFVRVMCNVNENKIDDQWQQLKIQLLNDIKKYIPEISESTLTTPLQDIIQQINSYKEITQDNQTITKKINKPKI